MSIHIVIKGNMSKTQNIVQDDLEFNLNQNIIEAFIFSSSEPITYKELKEKINDEVLLNNILISLEKKYSSSGINFCEINKSYAFRTSPEVSQFLNIEKTVQKPLSRAARETLAIIAYHQPITRPEIENIRGVSVGKGTFDILLDLGWIHPGQRRSSPGNPLTWKTSDNFLDYFGLKNISELPGIEDLKNLGLLEKDKIIFKD